MKDENIPPIIAWGVVAFIFVAGFILGHTVGKAEGKKQVATSVRLEAIELGLGAYVVENQTNMVWKWKGQK